MPLFKTFAAAPAVLAVISMTATPANAAELPELRAPAAGHTDAVPVFDVAEAQTADNHYRYRNYRYRRGPNAGDVIAGILIIGAIASVADRATRHDRDRDYRRDRDYPRDRDYRRDDVSWDDERGLDRAVQMCVDRIERDARIETVDRADRNARGWQIEGTLYDGSGFGCSIGQDGRIDDVDYDDRGARYDNDQGEDYDDAYARADVEDRQWDDDRYAAERQRMDRDVTTADATDAQASYPGGPVEGESEAEIDGDLEIGTGYPGA